MTVSSKGTALVTGAFSGIGVAYAGGRVIDRVGLSLNAALLAAVAAGCLRLDRQAAT